MIGLNTPARQAPDPMLFVSALMALADLADPDAAAVIIGMAQEVGDKRRAVLADAEADIATRLAAVNAAEAEENERLKAYAEAAMADRAASAKREAAIGAKAQALNVKLAEIDAKLAENKAVLAEIKAGKAEIAKAEAAFERREAKVANLETAAAHKMEEAEALRADAISKIAKINAIAGV